MLNHRPRVTDSSTDSYEFREEIVDRYLSQKESPFYNKLYDYFNCFCEKEGLNLIVECLKRVNLSFKFTVGLLKCFIGLRGFIRPELATWFVDQCITFYA